MRIQLIIWTIIISSVVTSCTKKNITSSNTNMHEASISGSWLLSHIGKEVITSKSPDKQPNITIDTSTKILSGYSGCNRMSGSIVTLLGTSLKFSPIAATKRICAEPNSESLFLQAFEQIESYGIEGSQLYLLNDNGDPLLTFVRVKAEK